MTASLSNCKEAAVTKSCSCVRLVALAMGAVTLGRAISQASANLRRCRLQAGSLFLQRIDHREGPSGSNIV